MGEWGFGVVAHVHGEPGAHGVLGGVAAAVEVAGLQRDLGDVRVVQGVADLFEDEAGGGLEVQDGSPFMLSGGLPRGPGGRPRSH